MTTTSPMLTRVLKAAVLRGASDVHAKAGDVFRARVEGELVALTKQRLTPQPRRDFADAFAHLLGGNVAHRAVARIPSIY